MSKFVLFSIAILSVFSFTESGEIISSNGGESRYRQNVNGEDEIEAAANYRKKLMQALVPKCAVAECSSGNGGRPDCHKSCNRPLKTVPDFSYLNRCVDTIIYTGGKPVVSRCKNVNKAVCKGGVEEACRRRQPRCLNGGCDIKMLAKESVADDCFLCPSGFRCGDVPEPRCKKIAMTKIRGSKMSTRDVNYDIALPTSNRTLPGGAGGFVHHDVLSIFRSATPIDGSSVNQTETRLMRMRYDAAAHRHTRTYFYWGSGSLLAFLIFYNVFWHSFRKEDKAKKWNQKETKTEYV